MSIDSKTIDIIIQATLKGGKTLESVTKSIGELEKALESQATAAKRGESSIDGLKATLVGLKAVQSDLKDQATLINRFEGLNKAIAKSESLVAKSGKTYTDFKAKLDQLAEPTEKQGARLLKLAASFKFYEEQLSKQKSSQVDLTKSMSDAGIAIDKLGDAEGRLRSSANRTAVAMLRTQQAITTYAEDINTAASAEKRLTENAAFQRKAEDAARLNRAGEFVRLWSESLNKADAAEKQLKINDALSKAADEAVAAARGYKTLGTSIKSFVGSQATLRSTVRGIVDPASQARATLSGVEEQIRKVAVAATNAKGPITAYREKVKLLADAQNAIGKQAELVDSFNRQLAVLRQARAEYVKARGDVLKYAEALRNSKGENDQLAVSLRAAQATLVATQTTLSTQVGVTRNLRDSLRAAGIATNDLAGSQSRLLGAAKASTAAMQSLTAAKRRYGEAVRSTGDATNLFNNSGRTTLSLLQRIRGQLLAVSAGYIGLYGAVNGATKVIDAFNTKVGIQNQLALSVGNDSAKIAEEFTYIRQQADRLGISFEVAAKGYAKFSASATLAGRSRQEIRYIFETFSEVGRVANLSTEQLDGTFKALEQIVSKGKIQAEELRGQLGDRLFGAFQVAAQALKDEFPQLDKAMKNGEVTSKELVRIAEKYKEIVGPRLAEATANLSASQARLNSELFDFKLLIADSGFADEYSKLIEDLSKFFKSSDGKAFAKDISDAFSVVARGLRFLMNNLETVKILMRLAFDLFVAKQIAGIGASAFKAGEEFRKLAGNAGLFQKVMLGLTALLVGFRLGEVMVEQFTPVKKAFIYVAIGFEEMLIRMKYGTKLFVDDVPNALKDAFSKVGNHFTKLFREIFTSVGAAYRLVGMDTYAKQFDDAARALTFRTDRVASKVTEIRKRMEAELASLRAAGKTALAEADKLAGATAPKGKPIAATGRPAIEGGTPTFDAEAAEKSAAKRLAIKEDLERALLAFEIRVEKNEKESLERRLNAIELVYQELLKKIRKFGGAEGRKLEARLDKTFNELKLQETRKFNDELLKERTGLETKLEQVEVSAGNKRKTDLTARLAAVEKQYADHYREIADYEKQLSLNGRSTVPATDLRARLDAGVVELKNLETQQYYQDAINSLLDERKARLDTIIAQEKAGLITTTQAREMSAALVADTQPALEAIVAEGLKYVEAMILAAEATGANTTALETLRAKLIEAQNSASGLRTSLISAAEVNEMLGAGAVKAFQSITASIAGAISGMNTWKDVLSTVRNAFLSFAADFLMEIAKMILKQALLNAIQAAGGGGGVGGIVSSAVTALLKHDGGVVGGGGKTRQAMSSWFNNAPRYHTGGIAGLAPDEYPAILKKNEEVLTQSDPRNVLNGGASGGASSPQNIKIINQIDSASVISEGVSTQTGTRAILNFISANRTEVKSLLGVS